MYVYKMGVSVCNEVTVYDTQVAFFFNFNVYMFVQANLCNGWIDFDGTFIGRYLGFFTDEVAGVATLSIKCVLFCSLAACNHKIYRIELYSF